MDGILFNLAPTGKLDVIRCLLEHKANPAAPYAKGYVLAPLHVSCSGPSIEAVEIFLADERTSKLHSHVRGEAQ